MEETIKSFRFKKDELVMLLLILGTEEIVGIRGLEEYQKLSEEKLMDKWNSVRGALQQKSYIREESNEVLEIESLLYLLLAVCKEAEKVLSLEISEKGSIKTHENFYISEDGTAELTTSDNEEFILSDCEDFEELAYRLQTHILDSFKLLQELKEKVSVILNKAQYFSFMAAMNMKNFDRAAKILTSLGLSQELAVDAAKGFMDKNCFMSFNYVDVRDKDKNTELLMFYKGSKSCWSIAISEEESSTMSLSNIYISDCIKSITEFALERFSSEERKYD